MQEYMAELSRSLPTGAVGGGSVLDRPAVQRVALLALELRGYAAPRLGPGPRGHARPHGRDLRRIGTAVTLAPRRGRVDLRPPVLALFEGDGRAYRALAAAAEIAALLQQREGGEEGEPPVVALAVGEAVTGRVVWGDAPLRAVVGMPVQQLEGLLREGTPGRHPALEGSLRGAARALPRGRRRPQSAARAAELAGALSPALGSRGARHRSRGGDARLAGAAVRRHAGDALRHRAGLAARRALPDPLGARRRRHGRGLQGARPRARRPGGAQDAEEGDGERRRRCSSA
jgi:hypothetical protein